MSLQEPHTDTDFWPRVKAHKVWPDVDEDALHDLGDAWKASATVLVDDPRTAVYTLHGQLEAAWPDTAGAEMRGNLLSAIESTGQSPGEDPLRWVWEAIHSLANSCYSSVAYVESMKWKIHRLIDDNRVAYAGADDSGRTVIVKAVVDDVEATLNNYCTAISRDGQHK